MDVNAKDDNGERAVAPISLPKGGGAIHGLGEKFDVDLATGTGSLKLSNSNTSLS